MMTSVTDPSGTDRVVERARLVDAGSADAGWAVAVIVLLAVVAIGTYLWTQYRGGTATETPASTNIEVTIPTPGPSSDANPETSGLNSFAGGLTGSSAASNTITAGY